MTGYLTAETIPTRRFTRRVSIPDDLQFIANVSGALLELADPEHWTAYGAATPEECAAAALDMIYQYWESNMIGILVPYISSGPPDGTLPCDGSTFLREDYPDLYGRLDSAYIIDADTFFLPDLAGRSLIGAGVLDSTDFLVAAEGGEQQHFLDESEMPPHFHDEVTAVSTVINGGLEAPASAAIPSVGITGSTGGGSAHNNMPPYHVVRYAVYYQ